MIKSSIKINLIELYLHETHVFWALKLSKNNKFHNTNRKQKIRIRTTTVTI